MDCPKCDGNGFVCDGCGEASISWRRCQECDGDFCSIVEGQDVVTGEPFTFGVRDCFHPHHCAPAPATTEER